MGAVVGATEPRHLGRLRELMPESIFLVPGVGAQGGDAAEPRRRRSRAHPASVLVPASRSIAGADDPAAAAAELRDQVWAVFAKRRPLAPMRALRDAGNRLRFRPLWPGASDDRKPTSWTARVLAPAWLLIVVAAAIVLVISGSLLGDDDAAATEAPGADDRRASCSPDARGRGQGRLLRGPAGRRQGLSGIAAKTCIPLDTLIELNPNLDPQALQVQQLRRPRRRRLQGARAAAECRGALRRAGGAARRSRPRRRRRGRRPPTCPRAPGSWSTPRTTGGARRAPRASARSRSPRRRS